MEAPRDVSLHMEKAALVAPEPDTIKPDTPKEVAMESASSIDGDVTPQVEVVADRMAKLSVEVAVDRKPTEGGAGPNNRVGDSNTSADYGASSFTFELSYSEQWPLQLQSIYQQRVPREMRDKPRQISIKDCEGNVVDVSRVSAVYTLPTSRFPLLVEVTFHLPQQHPLLSAGGGDVPIAHLEDEMDAKGISVDLILEWRRQQAEMYQEGSEGKSDVPVLSMTVRSHVAMFMLLLIQRAGLEQPKSFFDCMKLVDAYTHRAPKLEDGSIDVMKLPLICSAVVLVLLKFDSQLNHPAPNIFAPQVESFMAGLRQLGYPSRMVGEITGESFRAADIEVVQVVGQYLTAPTVYDWMHTYQERFNVLTRSRYYEPLQWVRGMCAPTLQILLQCQAATVELSPEGMAVGVLAFFMVRAQLLPLDYLRPEEICPAEWGQLYKESMSTEVLPLCSLTDSVEKFLEAVDLPLPVVKENCHRLAIVLRSAAELWKRIQQQHSPNNRAAVCHSSV